jgi:hypothetical protein
MGVLVTGDLRWAFAVAAIPVLSVGIRLAFDRNARQLSTATPDTQAEPERSTSSEAV